MGRIKGTVVKRTSKDLLVYDRARFTSKYEDNKKSVKEILPEVGKKVANSIAGYIARLVKREEEKSSSSSSSDRQY